MTWYLKKNDGEVYGPVDLPTLQLWATDGRVAPEDRISEDQKNWMPAPDLSDLSMDWNVELNNGSLYGPLHLLAIKELTQDGSVRYRAPVVNRKTGETSIVGEALIPVMMEKLVRLQSQVEQLTSRAPAPAVPAVDDKAAARAQEWEKTAKDLKAQVDDLREQAAKWKKLYEEEQAASLKRSKESKAPAGSPKAADDDVKKLQQDVEKWKKLYEQERAAGEKPKAKPAPSTAPGEGALVPRQQLDEVKLRLAQVERSYQQLLKTLNRSLSHVGGGGVVSPGSLRRRDVG